MKKTIFTSSAIVLLAALACSNEKDPQPVPKSRFDLLTAHPWKYISETDSTGKDIPFPQCEKDNLISFLSNNNLEINEGTDICAAGEPNTRPNTWALKDNDTKIYLNRPNVTRTILSLDETTLIVKDENTKVVGKLIK